MSSDVKVIFVDEAPSFPQQMSPTTPPEFAHCVIRKGYFDQMLQRIERHQQKPQKETAPTEIKLSESIILEIERWDGRPFRV